MLKKYLVSFKLNDHAWLNKSTEAENEKEAAAGVKEFFTGVVGKDRIKESYKGKNVVVKEINPSTQETDNQED